MRILFLGDIVGKPGRDYLKEIIPGTRESLELDCVIANGENAAGGSSITCDTATDILDAKIDIITTGDHAFKKKEAKTVLESMDVIRPLNYGDRAWGQGYLIKDFCGVKIAVVNLLGRVFMQPADCPFKAIDSIIDGIKNETNIVIVDMHAEATSEKLALGYYLSKRVSAVIGTHTHIPTADERIIDGHTAYITDVGMCGSFDSVLGREKAQIIERFISNMPVRFNLSSGDVRACGVILDIESSTGRALSIERVLYRKGN